KLLRMEEELHRRIISQESAISAVARAIRRTRAGLKNPNRPVGSFMFLGPTGVGKTEVARSLAAFLFGSERALIRFDMSEYMEKKGRMGFASGQPKDTAQSVNEMVMGEVKRTFNPEFINRVDEIIIFDALTDEDLSRITRLLVDQLNANLKEKGITVSIKDEGVDWLLQKTLHDRSYGARPPGRGPAGGGSGAGSRGRARRGGQQPVHPQGDAALLRLHQGR